MPFDGTEFRRQRPEIDGPVIKALLRGRRNIEQGWCQGAGRTRHGVCLTISLHGAPDHTTYAKAHMLLLRAIKETGFARGGISEFNDTFGRTKDEVLAVCDRAIELAFVAA